MQCLKNILEEKIYKRKKQKQGERSEVSVKQDKIHEVGLDSKDGVKVTVNFTKAAFLCINLSISLLENITSTRLYSYRAWWNFTQVLCDCFHNNVYFQMLPQDSKPKHKCITNRQDQNVTVWNTSSNILSYSKVESTPEAAATHWSLA